jgi:hypothetical protein
MNELHVMACRVRGAIEVFAGNPFQAVLSRVLHRHVRFYRVTAIPVHTSLASGRSTLAAPSYPYLTVVDLVVDRRRL